jgi:hypothetical protein
LILPKCSRVSGLDVAEAARKSYRVALLLAGMIGDFRMAPSGFPGAGKRSEPTDLAVELPRGADFRWSLGSNSGWNAG